MKQQSCQEKNAVSPNAMADVAEKGGKESVMKPSNAAVSHALPPVVDVRSPEQAALLGEAYSRERQGVLAALEELAAMGYGDRRLREATALATMSTLPDHGVMERAPREVLRLRAALFLASCHEHRRN
jgi:hypothetical protein